MVGVAPTRTRLSRESIVKTALSIIDEGGFDTLTLARVAEVAGCKAPSLYNHVAGLDDLLDDLCLAATGDFSSTLRDSVVAKVGEDAVRAYAAAWRAYVQTSPGRYQATLRPIPHRANEHGEVTLGMTIPAGSVLSTLGIPDERLPDAGRSLRSGLHGFCHLEMTNNIGPDPDTSFGNVIDVLISGLQSLADEHGV
jgi:AcrR family transcriptional regulator